jgi:hypothetical protein
MLDNQELVGETGSGEEQNQENNSTKAFSQEELDRIVAERVAREKKKFEKRFEGVDVDHYRRLSQAEDKNRMEVAQTRQEFEQLLQDTVGKREQTIKTLQAELQNIKVDGRLLTAASQRRAVNPDQVVKLLKENVRMAEDGEVEVVDAKTGKPRYSDKGTHLTIEEFVGEWLDSNPHFVTATPGGSGTQGRQGGSSSQTIDISKLDMSRAADREVYRQFRAQRQ